MRSLILLLAAVLPNAAMAEVLDKEFSLPAIAAWALLGTIAAYLSARHRPWLLIVVFAAVGSFFALHLTELTDPFVGPALSSEGGITYVFLSWFGPVAVLVGSALGLAVRKRRNARAGA